RADRPTHRGGTEMITRGAVQAWAVVTAVLGWLALRLETAGADEAGSPTLETVVIAAGLLALAIGLLVVIRAAVAHYAGQIPEASGSAGTQLSVVVTGVAPSLLPGLTMTVREAAAGPAEVFGAP